MVLHVYASSCSGKRKSDKCPLCMGNAETLSHFLLFCPALSECRAPLLSKLTDILQLSSPLSEETWLQIILDPSDMGFEESVIQKAETISRKLCFLLHHERAVQLGGCSAYSITRKKCKGAILFK